MLSAPSFMPVFYITQLSWFPLCIDPRLVEFLGKEAKVFTIADCW